MTEKQYDDTERLLADTLRQRGDVLGSADLPGVYGRSRAIRRRRTATVVVAAAAAVAAVVVPFSLMRGDGGTTTPPIATQSSTVTSPAPTTSSSPATSSGLAALTVGAKPAINYVSGSTWVNTDGSTQSVPTSDILAITPYHGGFLVLTGQQAGETGELVWFDNTGHVGWRHPSPGTPVVTRDTQDPFWATVDGTDSVLHFGIASGMSDLEQTQRVPGLDRVVGVLPDRRVVFTRASSFDGVWATDLRSAPVKLSGLTFGTSVSPTESLVAGVVADPGSGAAVVDVSTGRTLWTTSAMLGRFSPDGRLIVGFDEATGIPALYDAHRGGDPRCTAGKLFDLGLDLRGFQWESDQQLLIAAADQDGRQAILRVGLPASGNRCSVQRADTPAGIATTPYVLALRP